MKKKVEKVSRQIVNVLSQWQAVKTITLADAAEEELYSPYFFMSIDVYYRGELLTPEKRRTYFDDTATFESSTQGNKDRFIYEDLPVRLEYKNMDRIEAIIGENSQVPYVFRETGTYLFYRIKNNKILFQKSGWLNEIKDKIDDLPDSYWRPMINSCAATLEHQISDLGAAVMAEDDFFYMRSLSGWANTICSLMFLINHQFEPSGRRLVSHLFALKELPENFKGRFDCIITEDSEFGPSRKKEIAQHMTSQVIAMIQR